jgi:hypothetical protein
MFKKSGFPLFGATLVLIACILGCITICGLAANWISPGEELLAQCQMPVNGAKVRLYVCRGSSLTTSDCYSITYQRPGKAEAVIFSAYSSPFINRPLC